MKLVVHIPKTAGTSLRWALNKHFVESEVIRDYGPDAPETSDVVREHIYGASKSGGADELIRVISADNTKILIGHFWLPKYARYFDPRDIIAFVREPLVRTCSEYCHRKENRTFSGTLAQFMQMPGYQNLQSRYLKGVSNDSMIGITEDYRESLYRINSVFGWKLRVRKKNVARNKGGQGFADNLSVQERSLFYKINQQDIEFYHDRVQLFAKHKLVKNWRA